MSTQPSTSQLVGALYVGLFGRAPDAAGLTYWLKEYQGGNATFDQIAQGFTQDTTYQSKFNTADPELFVTNLYHNVLFRDPIGSDLAWWTDYVKEYGQAATAAAFVRSALSDDPAAVGEASGWTTAQIAQAQQAQQKLLNKVQVGLDFAVQLGDKTQLSPLGFLDPSLWASDPAYQAAQKIISVVDHTPESVATAHAIIQQAASATTPLAAMQIIEQGVTTGATQTFTLTASPESVTGTSGNDTFNGSDTTLTLDVLDGAGGNDTLNYSDATGGTDINSLGLTLTSIETINVRSTGAATATTTGFSGVQNVNVLLGTSATVDAGSDTNVSVSGVTGATTIDGGKNITVTHAVKDQDVMIGGTTAPTGNVTVTATNIGTGDIIIDGGVDVTVNVTASSGATTDLIDIGSTAPVSGTVKVTSAHKAVAGSDVALHSINVTGGTTITVTQTADTSKAATDTTGATLTQGDVTIVAGDATTTVTVTQAASQAEVAAVTAVAGKTETASVKFGALKAGDVLIMGGNGDGTLDAGELQITALEDLTAAEVAQAFANLLNPDTQGSGLASKVTYSTSNNTSFMTTWTSGAANGDTVVFTSTTANANVTDLAFNLTGTGTAPTVTTTDGAAATAAVTGKLGVITGAVSIDDNTTASITDVVINGYGDTAIGSTTALTKLQNLTLANSGVATGGSAGETNAKVELYDDGITSLNLTVNNVQGAINLDKDGSASIKTLNVTATGANSASALTAAAVETLTVKGDKSVDISTGTLSALKTVTVSESAGLNLGAAAAGTLTSVNTSATTGAVTVSIKGDQATYTGGAGVDTVTVTNPGTAISKAISLGGGNDYLDLSAADAVAPSVTLDGGDGTDTLKLTAAAASTLSGSTAFKDKLTGFERLELTAAGNTDGSSANVAVDLDKLGFASYVISNGTVNDSAKSDVLKLDNLASGGTLVIKAAAAGANTQHTVNIKDAATNTNDVLNLATSVDGNVNFGTVTAANVETVNLSATDTNTSNGIGTHTLTLTADKATSVNITGNANLALTLTGSTKVTSIDASSGYTGNLTVTSLNTTSATTIKGGSGNDTLTAATGTTADKLFGGAGDDILVANAGLTQMTGGAGRDTFLINTPSLNVNSYATILDFTSDDVIKLAPTNPVVGFLASKVTLGDTAVFQDYANAAMNALDTTTAGGSLAAWFQYGGNTYIVVDEATTDSTTFINGEDLIVKITGLVDLSNASFNDTHGTIALV